ncbi:unnamed protein product [Linum trigynum]|uniref:Uncharacterized protein n=1 Tax=Linum trigynum TaxID=586398 RepID=A0AAV2F8E4_9ROSI
MGLSKWGKSRIQVLLPTSLPRGAIILGGISRSIPISRRFPSTTRHEIQVVVGHGGFHWTNFNTMCTPKPELKRELQPMVERFARGTDEGCSMMDLPISYPFDSTFLRESEELLRHMERLGGLVEQACAQLATIVSYHLKEERKSER